MTAEGLSDYSEWLRMGIMLKRYCSFTSDKEAGTNENRLTDDVARDLGADGIFA